MKKSFSPVRRVVFDCVLLLSIFLLPWWLVMVVGMIGVIIFGGFYEFIVAGIVLDLLYLPIEGGHIRFFASGLFFIVFLFVYWIRTRIRS